jgi:hypothetical protein
MTMIKVLILPVAVILAFAPAPVSAQKTTPDSLTNCHTPGTADQSGAKENETTGKATGNAQDVEKSAILPDAGGEGSSAAPTVQRDGKSVEARTDCPDDPKTPKN